MIIKFSLNPVNWSNRHFFSLIALIYFPYLGLLFLKFLGQNVQVLTTIVGLIFIISIPGMLILRILKLRNLNLIDTLLFCIGTSITLWMILGCIINFTLEFLGYQHPISEITLILGITILILLLSIGSYLVTRKENFANIEPDPINYSFSPRKTAPFLLLFIAIIGTSLVNFFNNYFILVSLFFVISAICIYLGYKSDRSININYYLLIYLISLSLLWYSSLITSYIWGWDNILEYYLSNQVLQNQFWNYTIANNVNGMLSIVILAPIFSLFCDMSLVWVYKIIYPLFFALLPVIVYRIVEIQTDKKIALFSAFFLMFEGSFYNCLFTLARQEIAEIFFALFLLVLVLHTKTNKFQKGVILFIFGFSITISHYGTTYLVLLILFFAFAIMIILNFVLFKQYYSLLSNKFKILDDLKNRFYSNICITDRNLSVLIIILFSLLAYTWYTYFASSEAFFSILQIFNKIGANFVTDFASTQNTEGLSQITRSMGKFNILHILNAIILYSNQILIIIGIFAIIFIRSNFKINKEYYTIILAMVGLLIGTIVVPFFASALMLFRIYHLTLIVLSSCFIIGFIALFRVIAIFRQYNIINFLIKNMFLIISIYLVFFLLFQSGILFQYIEGSSGSIILDTGVDGPKFNPQEVSGATWFYNYNSTLPIYADVVRWQVLASFNWNPQDVELIKDSSGQIQNPSYIFIGTKNIIQNKLYVGISPTMPNPNNFINLKYLVNDKNKIFVNGGSEIYMSH